MTEKEQEKFWEGRRISRKALDERFKRLPLTEQIEILEKMRVNHEVMRNANPEH